MKPDKGQIKGKLRRITIFITILTVILLVFYLMIGSYVQSLLTLRKIDDQPFYTMKYLGNYHFDSFLQTGISEAAYNKYLQTGNYLFLFEDVRKLFYPDWIWNILKMTGMVQILHPQSTNACSAFFTINGKGERIFGRNFDLSNRPSLLLETNPAQGFRSYSMVDISNLGYGYSYPDPFLKRAGLITAPYLCLDGMNEYGLAVGEMMIPEPQPLKDPAKKTITDTEAIRLILDYAKDVPQAIKLLREYNIHFPVTVDHYLIADRKGNSAIVEYVNGEMVVINKEGPFQIATNFTIYNTGHKQRMYDYRYAKAYQRLESKNGDISQEEAMEILKEISQENTMWSVVYNLTSGDILVTPGRKYNKIYKYNLSIIDAE